MVWGLENSLYQRPFGVFPYLNSSGIDSFVNYSTPSYDIFNYNPFSYTPDSNFCYNPFGQPFQQFLQPVDFSGFSGYVSQPTFSQPSLYINNNDLSSNSIFGFLNNTGTRSQTSFGRRTNSGGFTIHSPNENSNYFRTNCRIYNINGYQAYALKDLELNGKISSGNSKPYIGINNVKKLKTLDELLTSWGYEITYTSGMGGHSRGGHVRGNKIDFQLTKNGSPTRLTQAQEQYLAQQGYYGKGTGAVGWENHREQTGGGHYDIYIA